MTKHIYKYFLSALAALILLLNCTSKKTEIVWKTDFPRIGSQSSPRAADLNQDGVLDIVMGAGRNEYQHSKQGVLAINGQTGKLLWQQEADDQVFGSATFYDITGDGIEDIMIGGRSPKLKALDGKNGDVIWAYNYQYEHDPILKYANCNFYNSVLVPDQNGDGIPELLTVNGGNPKVDPYVLEGRVPGVLMVFNTLNGEILAADTMPDGKESYMSPVYFKQPETGEDWIVFGSGGETISGNLYLARLSSLMRGRLSEAQIIASEDEQGFVAPPVVVDIDADGYYDIATISHRGRAMAINGKTRQLMWEQRMEDTESSASFAVGYFTDDEVPDFFTFVSKGQWPDNTTTYQMVLDGRTGNITFIDSVGCIGFSSAVVSDLNRDGQDEVIFSVNDYDCNQGLTNNPSKDIVSRLLYINFKEGSVNPIDQLQGFKNIFSTPWIGDMDDDGYLDIVHCQYFNYSTDLILFLGMHVKRISTAIRVKKPVIWGAYMGSNGDGVFPM